VFKRRVKPHFKPDSYLSETIS